MYHEALLHPTEFVSPLCRLGDLSESTSLACNSTPQVLPGLCGPPSGPPRA